MAKLTKKEKRNLWIGVGTVAVIGTVAYVATREDKPKKNGKKNGGLVLEGTPTKPKVQVLPGATVPG